jgi:7-keto-8-aminopelargonate synthetase-like enzyme
MYGSFKNHLSAELQEIRERGLYKQEPVLATPLGVEIRTESGAKVLNFCANNYLGLCNEPRVMAAANSACFRWGFGMASVRFICGTQDVHKELERRMADFLGMDDAKLSQDFANVLLDEGIYVIGFSFPVVPAGKSRIRVQISAAHTPDEIDFALEKFRKVAKRLGAV